MHVMAAEQDTAHGKTAGAQIRRHATRTSGRSRGDNHSYREPEVGSLCARV